MNSNAPLRILCIRLTGKKTKKNLQIDRTNANETLKCVQLKWDMSHFTLKFVSRFTSGKVGHTQVATTGRPNTMQGADDRTGTSMYMEIHVIN